MAELFGNIYNTECNSMYVIWVIKYLRKLPPTHSENLDFCFFVILDPINDRKMGQTSNVEGFS